MVCVLEFLGFVWVLCSGLCVFLTFPLTSLSFCFRFAGTCVFFSRVWRSFHESFPFLLPRRSVGRPVCQQRLRVGAHRAAQDHHLQPSLRPLPLLRRLGAWRLPLLLPSRALDRLPVGANRRICLCGWIRPFIYKPARSLYDQDN